MEQAFRLTADLELHRKAFLKFMETSVEQAYFILFVCSKSSLYRKTRGQSCSVSCTCDPRQLCRRKENDNVATTCLARSALKGICPENVHIKVGVELPAFFQLLSNHFYQVKCNCKNEDKLTAKQSARSQNVTSFKWMNFSATCTRKSDKLKRQGLAGIFLGEPFQSIAGIKWKTRKSTILHIKRKCVTV